MVRELHVWGVRKRDSMVRKRSGGSLTSLGKFGFAKVRLRQCAGSIVYIPLPLCLHFNSGRNENVLCLAVLVRQAMLAMQDGSGARLFSLCGVQEHLQPLEQQ